MQENERGSNNKIQSVSSAIVNEGHCKTVSHLVFFSSKGHIQQDRITMLMLLHYFKLEFIPDPYNKRYVTTYQQVFYKTLVLSIFLIEEYLVLVHLIYSCFDLYFSCIFGTNFYLAPLQCSKYPTF